MANSDDQERKRQELLRTLAETKEIAPKLIEKGRNLTEAGRSALDWATHIENLAENVPAIFLNPRCITVSSDISSAFREFNSVAQKQYERIGEDENLKRIIHSTTTSTSVSTSAAAFASFSNRADEIPELRSMQRLLHRTVDLPGIRSSMTVLGLGIARGDTRSPVELLQNSDDALRRPFSEEGGATAVLVPLREAIQGSVEELLKRRPITEKTSSWADKVTSIATHCGKSGLSSELVDRVAATTHTLINELSGAKDRRMNRDRTEILFDQGVSLLEDLISLVDPEKLRPLTK